MNPETETGQKNRKKEALKNILLFAATIAIMLLITEAFFRFYYYPYVSPYKPDENLMYTLRPSLETVSLYPELTQKVRTNKDGFVFQNPDKEKNEETKRIFIVGDSFAEGFYLPPEKRFTKRLQEKLNQSNQKFEVISFGAGSWGTPNEYMYIKKKALQYNPDQIILLFYFNDLENVGRTALTSFENGTVKDLTPVKMPLLKRAAMACTEHSSACYWTYINHLSTLVRMAESLGSHFSSSNRTVNVTFNYDVESFRTEQPQEITEAWKDTGLLIRDLNEMLKQKGIKFTVVHIPAKIEIEEEDYQNYLKEHGLKEDKVDMTSHSKALAGQAKQYNISYHDAREALLEDAKKGRVYTKEGLHFTEEGEKTFSNVLYEAVADAYNIENRK